MASPIRKINCIDVGDLLTPQSTIEMALYAISEEEARYNNDLDRTQRVAKLVINLDGNPIKYMEIWLSKTEEGSGNLNVYLQIYDKVGVDERPLPRPTDCHLIHESSYPLINLMRSGGIMMQHAEQILTEELAAIVAFQLPFVVTGNDNMVKTVKKCILTYGSAPLTLGEQIVTTTQLREAIASAVSVVH